MAKKKPNWRKIAIQLAQRVNFACTHLSAKGEGSGGGCILNINSGSMTHWKDYFAEALEMVPGVKVDHELLHAKNSRARNAIINARKKAVGATSTSASNRATPSAAKDEQK